MTPELLKAVSHVSGHNQLQIVCLATNNSLQLLGSKDIVISVEDTRLKQLFSSGYNMLCSHYMCFFDDGGLKNLWAQKSERSQVYYDKTGYLLSLPQYIMIGL